MASVAGSSVAQAPAQGLQSFAPKSSFLSFCEYDPTNLTLTTHLKSGAIFQHKFVLPLEWTNFQTAQNHGSFWSKSIKGKHLSVKVKHVKSPNARRAKK